MLYIYQPPSDGVVMPCVFPKTHALSTRAPPDVSSAPTALARADEPWASARGGCAGPALPPQRRPRAATGRGDHGGEGRALGAGAAGGLGYGPPRPCPAPGGSRPLTPW